MENKNRNLLLIGIGAVLLLCCCCMALSLFLGAAFWFNGRSTEIQPSVGPVLVVTPELAETASPAAAEPAGSATPVPMLVTPQAQPTSSRGGGTEPPPLATTSVISNTEEMLASVNMPERDLRNLAQRLKPGIGVVPVVVNQAPPSYSTGDKISFWTGNSDTHEHRAISATLRYMTPHVYVWVQDGVNLNDGDLAASADRFESKTYSMDRGTFGSEWTPGVDNDAHINILHARDLGTNIAGYYSSADEFSNMINPYSNQKEMIYLSADEGGARPNTAFYDGVLAHEFQHMIHWNNDRNEPSWVNEGMSELAAHVNGYEVGGMDLAYAKKPDTQLNTWDDATGGNAEHYGASYLFMNYLLGRFGKDIIKDIVADRENGIAGIDDALAKAGRSERFDDLYADWLVANYLNRPDADPQGRFGYREIQPPVPAIEQKYSSLPASGKATVKQYGADYILIDRPGDAGATVKFDGQTDVNLVNTDPRGKYAWWSNRGDDSDSTLTRAFDLSGLTSATLNFSAWYDVEEGYDYVYAEVSTDGGRHWQILPGRQTNNQDKSGNAFGPGWTGKSGGGKVPQWIEERVDLSPYAGQKILVRFEYVTDDAVNGPGFLLDEITLPELNYRDTGENGAAGWQSNGWILTDNNLPQRWLVEVITSGPDGVQVQRMPIGADGKGQVRIPKTSGLYNLMLIVSGQTPVTTEPAEYSYNVSTP